MHRAFEPSPLDPPTLDDSADARPPVWACRTQGAWCRTPILWVSMVLLLSTTSGCSVWRLADRTLNYEPRLFEHFSDEGRSMRRFRNWAHEAWEAEAMAGAVDGYTGEYRSGFDDGFIDYVMFGGRGAVPAVPPRRFWRVGFRNRDGDQAIADWMAGFRHGTESAVAGAYRDRILLPTQGTLQHAYHDDAHVAWDQGVLTFETVVDPDFDASATSSAGAGEPPEVIPRGAEPLDMGEVESNDTPTEALPPMAPN